MKKTVLVLITFALIIAVAGSGFWLVHYFIDSREQRQTYETLAEEFVLESTPTPESTTPAENSSPTENSSETAESVSLTTATPRHDLAALAAENADCVGWLTIPDTGIDYPVMHTPDDPEHYLRRDFYGESASGGTPLPGWSEPGRSRKSEPYPLRPQHDGRLHVQAAHLLPGTKLPRNPQGNLSRNCPKNSTGTRCLPWWKPIPSAPSISTPT